MNFARFNIKPLLSLFYKREKIDNRRIITILNIFKIKYLKRKIINKRIFFPQRNFHFKNRKIDLYLNKFNCGDNINYRLTERSIELALAKEWLKNKSDFIEIGAVTPYYQDIYIPHDVIDPMDSHKLVNIKKSMFEKDLKDSNILSISTIEHIGTNDYGLHQKETAIDAFNKIINESKTCFITFPLGYNKTLDDFINHIYGTKNYDIIIYSRSWNKNDWKIMKNLKKEYQYGPLWANYLCIIIKNEI